MTDIVICNDRVYRFVLVISKKQKRCSLGLEYRYLQPEAGIFRSPLKYT